MVLQQPLSPALASTWEGPYLIAIWHKIESEYIWKHFNFAALT